MENVAIPSGTRVRFALSRVMCPELDEICKQIDSGLKVEGRVVFLSDYGDLQQHFAIVQVEGIHVPVVVPVEDLQLQVGKEVELTKASVRKQERVG